ncbi:MAG: PqqD family protein [Rhodothermia bacterium]|nr:PqqD family protein [Rhodothermia bacterium]
MNPVAAFVWQRLEAPSSFGDVRDAIMHEFEVDRETCERDLAALLSNLVEAGLVHVHRQAA